VRGSNILGWFGKLLPEKSNVQNVASADPYLHTLVSLEATKGRKDQRVKKTFRTMSNQDILIIFLPL